MSVSISTIQSLVAQYPLGLFTAHHWYSDHPADTSFVFSGIGHFTGGDLPFGIIYETHAVPGDRRQLGLLAVRYTAPVARLTNYGAILGGYGSTVAVEEFLLDRPRGLIMFHEPSTNRIDLEIDPPCELQVWGLYIDIPLITPTQMTYTVDSLGPVVFPSTTDGTAFPALTDSGSIALDAGTIGARVDITVHPASLGIQAGDPLVAWDLGWINWGRADGAISRERITGDNWLSFAPAAILSDVLYFSLHPGVEATITCLIANP